MLSCDMFSNPITNNVAYSIAYSIANIIVANRSTNCTAISVTYSVTNRIPCEIQVANGFSNAITHQLALMLSRFCPWV